MHLSAVNHDTQYQNDKKQKQGPKHTYEQECTALSTAVYVNVTPDNLKLETFMGFF